MRLTLYHFQKLPVSYYNVIKFTMDDRRELVVKIKEKSKITVYRFKHEKDYQRLTVVVD